MSMRRLADSVTNMPAASSDSMTFSTGILTDDRGKNAVLKFLVTSRPYFSIEGGFEELISSLPTIRLAGEKERVNLR